MSGPDPAGNRHAVGAAWHFRTIFATEQLMLRLRQITPFVKVGVLRPSGGSGRSRYRTPASLRRGSVSAVLHPEDREVIVGVVQCQDSKVLRRLEDAGAGHADRGGNVQRGGRVSRKAL